MAIKIIKSSDPILTENLIIVLYAQPGAGKTTLAFSASKPLLLDFDLGAQRALGRKDCVMVNRWIDIADLSADDLVNYNTIVIDTAGRALEILTANIIASTPKLARSTGELQLQGYGALGTAFKTWLNKLRSFKKDVILICHDKEDKNGDNLFVRPDAMGSSRVELTKIADLMGYVSMNGKNRSIDFNPTDQHLGKNPPCIPEQQIPHITDNSHFMTDLLRNAKDKMNAKSEAQLQAEKSFNNALEMIDKAVTAEDFNIFLGIEYFKNTIAVRQHLHNQAISKGLIANKEKRCYESPIETESQFENNNTEELV